MFFLLVLKIGDAVWIEEGVYYCEVSLLTICKRFYFQSENFLLLLIIEEPFRFISKVSLVHFVHFKLARCGLLWVIGKNAAASSSFALRVPVLIIRILCRIILLATNWLFIIIIKLHLTSLHLLQLLKAFSWTCHLWLLTLLPRDATIFLLHILLCQLFLLIILRKHFERKSTWLISWGFTVLFWRLLVLRGLDISVACLVFDVNDVCVRGWKARISLKHILFP